MTKRLLETLKRNPGDRVPFWFMRQAGRYLPEYLKIRASAKNFMDFCYSPDKAAEVTLQPLRRFNMDGAILFADILIVPDGLGQKTWFEPGVGPRLDAIDSEVGVNTLSMANFHDHVAPIYETIRRVKKELPEHVTFLGFAGAPWTVMTYMIAGAGSKDHAAAKLLGYQAPKVFNAMMEIVVDATSEYLIKQIDAGVDVVQIFDSWSAAIPEKYFEKWVIAPTKEIVRRVKTVHPETPIIGFPRLSAMMYKRYVQETGVEGVSLDSGVPLNFAAGELQPHVCVQGNLDPLLVVAGGEAMEQEAYRILEGLKGGAHIFNVGHGFVPQTPPDHVARLSEIISTFRR